MGRSSSNETALIDLTPTVDTGGAYADNDLIGSKLTLANAVRQPGAGGVIESVTVIDEAAQGAALDIVFFTADPTATTFTDQAAEAIADGDGPKILAIVSVAGGDYVALAGCSVATKNALNIAFVLPAGETALYAAIVSGGTPSFGNAADLTLRVGILGD